MSCPILIIPLIDALAQNEQRQRRKDEAAAGQPWQLKYFEHVDSDPVYKQLAAQVKGIPSEEDAYIFRGRA